MSNKLAAVCPVCPMTFTAKHRQQIREMIDDHLVAHYAVLEDVKRDKETIQRVSDLLDKYVKVDVSEIPASLLSDALSGQTTDPDREVAVSQQEDANRG